MFSKNKNSKGFTLIEVLTVVAIVGILSSVVIVGLRGARGQARDGKRISELRQVQNALELYYSACGFYPGGTGCAKSTVPQNWNDLTAVLAGVAGGRFPKDPLSPTQDYKYAVNAAKDSYVLSAELEGDNAIFRDPNTLTGVPAGNYEPTISCDVGQYEYCISF